MCLGRPNLYEAKSRNGLECPGIEVFGAASRHVRFSETDDVFETDEHRSIEFGKEDAVAVISHPFRSILENARSIMYLLRGGRFSHHGSRPPAINVSGEATA